MLFVLSFQLHHSTIEVGRISIHRARWFIPHVDKVQCCDKHRHHHCRCQPLRWWRFLERKALDYRFKHHQNQLLPKQQPMLGLLNPHVVVILLGAVILKLLILLLITERLQYTITINCTLLGL